MEQIKIKNLKRKDKGALVAQFDLVMEDRKVSIRECLFLSNQNGDWVNFPSRRYEVEGDTRYFNYVLFLDEEWKEVNDRIAELVRKELDGMKADQVNMELEAPF